MHVTDEIGRAKVRENREECKGTSREARVYLAILGNLALVRCIVLLQSLLEILEPGLL